MNSDEREKRLETDSGAQRVAKRTQRNRRLGKFLNLTRLSSAGTGGRFATSMVDYVAMELESLTLDAVEQEKQ